MEYTRNSRWLCFSAVFSVLFFKTGMACQMEELAFEIHTTGRIPCLHNVSLELIHLVRWTKSTHEDCYQNGDDYLAAWNGVRVIQDQNYGIDTDFSLVIPDVTTTFIGIYRCTVVPKDATAISDSDTRLTVYKYPDNPPSITYEILGGNEIEINCTHGPVFPLLYPSFPFPNHNNYTIRNNDGTYMVSIKAVQQFSGSEITLYCSHSYPGQHRSSFLNVHRSDNKQEDYTTHPQESKTTQKNNSIPTEPTLELGPRDSTFGIIIVILILMIIIIPVMGLVVLFHERIMKSIQKPVHDPEKQEMVQKLVQHPGKQEMDNRHESKLMFMQFLLMMELEEVKSKLQVIGKFNVGPKLCQRSEERIMVTPDDDQSKEYEQKNMVHSLKGSPEQTPMMTKGQDEDEERKEIGYMPIVNRLRNIPEEQERNGMSREIAIMRALQEMKTSEPVKPQSTEGEDNRKTIGRGLGQGAFKANRSWNPFTATGLVQRAVST